YIDASMRLGFDSNQKPAMKPWDMLEPSYKQSNRDQADHISVKIRSINCKIVPLMDANNNIEFAFSPMELEMLGKMEHSRWCANRRLEGYVYGSENDLIKKTSPYLVAWEELDEDIKSYDKNAVKIIPRILNEAGYCIQRICSI
ncbi:MAG: RyR domain-containing protein, partial [Gemmataceae bacterium]